MNKQIPQSLVDEISTLHDEMPIEKIKERKELLSIIGNLNYIFDYKDEEEINEDY
jgi:hypothetical protein